MLLIKTILCAMVHNNFIKHLHLIFFRHSLKIFRIVTPAKRRKMELELVHDLWNALSLEVMDALVHFDNVPKSMQKKCNKIIKSHILHWHSLDATAFARVKRSDTRDVESTV